MDKTEFFERVYRYLAGRRAAAVTGLAALMLLTAGAGSVKHVTVVADGQETRLTTTHTEPGKIIAEAGVAMGAYDEYRMTSIRVKDETEIHVVRAVPVTFEMGGTARELWTARATVGRLLEEMGIDRAVYRPTLNDDVPIRKGLHIRLRTQEEIAAEQKALEEELARRQRCVETSRGFLRYTSVRVMEASAYLPTDGGGSCITATGLPARHGIVAVDPDVIPLGTRLYIPGYGIALAADTGGMIVGDMIDLCMEDYDDAIQFGRRDIDVYILE